MSHNLFFDVADHISQLEAENKSFRRLLFGFHSCSGVYGDDGEMQCNRCFIDFKRDSAAAIKAKLSQKALEYSACFIADSKEAGFGDMFEYAKHIMTNRKSLGLPPDLCARLDAFLRSNGRG